MNHSTKKNAVALIGLYRVFSRMYFYLPIIFPLFYYRGESILETETLLSLYTIAVIFLSTPVRYITRHWGHKLSLILGEAFKIVGLLIIIFYSNNFLASFFAQLLMGLGYTFIVGNDTVILQQAFDFSNSEEYQRAQKTTNNYIFLSLFISGIIGTMLFSYSSSLVLELSIVAALCSIFVISLMKYSYKKLNTQDNKVSYAIDQQAKFYYFFVRSLALPIFIGIIPNLIFIVEKASIYYFTLIITSFTLAGFISSKYITSHLIKYSFKLISAISFLLIIASLSLLFFQSKYWAIITVIILGLCSGCVRPVTILKINAQKFNIEKTLKNAEFNYGIFSSILLIATGIILEHLSFSLYLELLILLLGLYGIIKIYNLPRRMNDENLF